MLFIFLAFLFACSSFASERILVFTSYITMQNDASMSVVEAIKVHATGETIRRGIVREFPTRYKDSWGNRFNVDFQVYEVLRDGHPEPYHIESVSNGKKIYIGSKEVMLAPGTYTYAIHYKVNRQIGFFKNHDELYWNVTGNGWRLPIDKAEAFVYVPAPIPIDQIHVEGYTGSQGSKDQHYKASVSKDGIVYIETTAPLKVYQGLTVVVTWPKGYIKQPSAWQEWWWFFKDNLHIVIALLGLLCLLAWYIFAWVRFKATQYSGTIIPLFYPPKGITPGFMRYFMRMKYDSVVLAADIVDMAVHGFLTIEYTRGMIWGSQYTLRKVQEPKDTTPHYGLLFATLLGHRSSIVLDEENAKYINAAVDLEKGTCQKESRPYFTSAHWYFSGGMFISIVFAIALLIAINVDSAPFFIIVAIFALINVCFFSLLRGYTKQGLQLQKEIEGFKMFLIMTEQERLKIIGTPPTKTPQLYEKYLPYAMALGVEKQWSAQFAPMFEEMRKSGHPYVFVWYTGDFRSFSSTSFASNISNSISSSISSSSDRPGSSSGSGGSGSSGGGGGGGGGGGW